MNYNKTTERVTTTALFSLIPETCIEAKENIEEDNNEANHVMAVSTSFGTSSCPFVNKIVNTLEAVNMYKH